MQKHQAAAFYAAWFISLAAVAGSLYFSNVRGFPPCVLCWWQRVFIYPLVLIIASGILRRDAKLYHYVLPLSIGGLGVAIYHNLLYYGIIPESIAPCVNGISCTTKFIEYFGFITIPFLSLCAFLAITILMLVARRITQSRN